MDLAALHAAIDQLPAGRWAVGVSGGADSVALLLLMHNRPDLMPHVVHLDHETRHGESVADAQFVSRLAASMGLKCTVERRSALEAKFGSPAVNISNRFRLARLALFRQVVDLEGLAGVVLAHHADDQAETVLMRVLRGASLQNLREIQPESIVNGLRIVRPLLKISSANLKDFLQQRGQCWREDSSNQSLKYQRNRARQWFANHRELPEAFNQLGRDSDLLFGWLNENSPVLEPSFPTTKLSNLPLPLARHASARWLMDGGSPPAEINTQTCDRLIQMASDAASPARQHFPGGLLVRRKQSRIFVDPKSSEQNATVPR